MSHRLAGPQDSPMCDACTVNGGVHGSDVLQARIRYSGVSQSVRHSPHLLGNSRGGGT